jgi:bifunctional non-homologous end joining protein LigD
MARIKVEITHPDRVLFPDGITKADLVDYYDAVAEVMLPHLKGRPLTLWRYPRGIDEQGFVQQTSPVPCRTG